MEIEFKFEVPGAGMAAVVADLQAREKTKRPAKGAAPGKEKSTGCKQTRLQAFYFDTPARELAANRIVLRVRKEGDRWVQTVKAQGDGPLHRLEHNVARDAAARAEEPEAPPAPDLQLHRDSPIWTLIEKTLGLEAVVLTGIYGTDITRLSRVVKVGASTVELALDRGSITAFGDEPARRRSDAVSELELELVDGRFEDLVRLAQQWRSRHGLWISTLSKAERGERLLVPATTALAVRAVQPVFPDDEPGTLSGAAIQRIVVGACLAQVLPNASEVASGNEDPEIVHQLRVGLRRLRTALQALDGIERIDARGDGDGVEGFDPSWTAPLKTAFQALGVLRDRHALTSKVLPKLRDAGAPAVTLPQLAATSAREAIRDTALQDVLVGLLAFTAPQSPAAAGMKPEKNKPLPINSIAERLNKLHRQVAKDAKAFEGLSAEGRHRLRKRLKRQRYLVEFTGPLFGSKAAARYARNLEPAQDALGELMDDVVALTAFRSVADRDTRAWFAVGWFSAQLKLGETASATALQHLTGNRRFWKKYLKQKR